MPRGILTQSVTMDVAMSQSWDAALSALHAVAKIDDIDEFGFDLNRSRSIGCVGAVVLSKPFATWPDLLWLDERVSESDATPLRRLGLTSRQAEVL